MVSLFDFRDYKNYLATKSVERGLRSGFKSALARACGCNSAYISSVLGGNAHLSLEQAERACGFLQLNSEETDYVLLLVQRARAGTPSLRNYFDARIDRAIEQRLSVQKRMGIKERMSPQDQNRYYSSWTYAAIHVALSIPRLAQSTNALAKYFDLSPSTVNKVLEFLLSCGLAVEKGSGYAIGPRHIHIGKNSENIQRHHTNWRLQIIRALESECEQNLNYSSVVTLSREDAYKVREILLSSLKQSADVIMTSPEEEVYAMAVDFSLLRKGPQ